MFTDNSKCRRTALQSVDNYYSVVKSSFIQNKSQNLGAFHERRFSSNALCLIARSLWMPPPKRLGLFSYYVVCLLKRQISFVNMQNLGNWGAFLRNCLSSTRGRIHKRNISCQHVIKLELAREKNQIHYLLPCIKLEKLYSCQYPIG